jgi:NHLM bacteriocin system ABC transporter peptidase/ATP-binding protein
MTPWGLARVNLRPAALWRGLRHGFRREVARLRRRRTPTILQMEAVECGAAALAIVLGHFGRLLPLEELRLACGVSRDGSKASNIVRAARRYGLVCRGLRKEPGQLRDLPMPAIVHWNFNHFVVVEGFGAGEVFLNDPASGPRIVSDAEFDFAFTGIVLVFERTPEFRAGGQGRTIRALLQRRLRGGETAVAYVILAGVALLIPGLLAPTFTKIFVDEVLVKGLAEWFRPLLIVMGASAAVTFVLILLQQRYLLRLESRLAVGGAGAFFWHVLRLPMEFFTQRYAGEIGSRVGLNDKVAGLLSGELATTAINLMVVATYAFLLFRYDSWLALIGIGIACLNLAALHYVSRRRTDMYQSLLQDRGKLMGVAMGGLQTIETLKASGAESDFFSRWSGHQAKVVNAQQRLAVTTILLSAVPPLLLAVNNTLILGMGGARVMDGHLTIGMLVAFQALMLAFLSPVNKMVDLGSTLQEVRGDLARLDDVLRAEPDQPAVPQTADAPAAGPVKLQGTLELQEVTFGYSRLEPPLLEKLSLRLEPGRRVALVGPSGSGKSTVSKLVAGLYQPWSGEILFDGVRREEIPRSVLANSVAVVDQEICLFAGTIRENVSLWDATIPDSQLLRAAKDACIHDEVSVRAGGYAHPVEEGGRNFSGGQRQRMEIARALAANPRLLVLDEATSALDPATEKRIDDNLRARGCTCLIVAHRLSTIRDCDEILVMDRGKVVQRGTHDELSAVAGPYRDLISVE